jgi:hypothetical protein
MSSHVCRVLLESGHRPSQIILITVHKRAKCSFERVFNAHERARSEDFTSSDLPDDTHTPQLQRDHGGHQRHIRHGLLCRQQRESATET